MKVTKVHLTGDAEGLTNPLRERIELAAEDVPTNLLRERIELAAEDVPRPDDGAAVLLSLYRNVCRYLVRYGLFEPYRDGNRCVLCGATCGSVDPHGDLIHNEWCPAKTLPELKTRPCDPATPNPQPPTPN